CSPLLRCVCPSLDAEARNAGLIADSDRISMRGSRIAAVFPTRFSAFLGPRELHPKLDVVHRVRDARLWARRYVHDAGCGGLVQRQRVLAGLIGAILGRWLLVAYALLFGATVWSFVHWYEEP